MSNWVISPARCTRSASNTQWYKPPRNAAAATIQPMPRWRIGGCSTNTSTSRKPTCTARTTELDKGLNAAVMIWNVEKAIATQNKAPANAGA